MRQRSGAGASSFRRSEGGRPGASWPRRTAIMASTYRRPEGPYRGRPARNPGAAPAKSRCTTAGIQRSAPGRQHLIGDAICVALLDPPADYAETLVRLPGSYQRKCDRPVVEPLILVGGLRHDASACETSTPLWKWRPVDGRMDDDSRVFRAPCQARASRQRPCGGEPQARGGREGHRRTTPGLRGGTPERRVPGPATGAPTCSSTPGRTTRTPPAAMHCGRAARCSPSRATRSPRAWARALRTPSGCRNSWRATSIPTSQERSRLPAIATSLPDCGLPRPARARQRALRHPRHDPRARSCATQRWPTSTAVACASRSTSASCYSPRR